MTTFFDRLGDELDAAARRPPRRPAAPLLAAAAAVVAVAALGFAVARPEPASADVDVSVRGGLVHLRLVDAEHDPEAIEAAAAGAGLDVAVEAVPAGPSQVGRFLMLEQRGERPGELRPLDADGDTFAGFVLPVGWDGTLQLRVGRPARAGEGYVTFTNAESAGEPLACTGIGGATPAEALEILDGRDLDVTWQVVGERSQVVPPDDLAGFDDHRVAMALGTAPGAVVLVLTADGAPPPSQQALTRPAAGCSP